jgi:hypothetical protein
MERGSGRVAGVAAKTETRPDEFTGLHVYADGVARTCGDKKPPDGQVTPGIISSWRLEELDRRRTTAHDPISPDRLASAKLTCSDPDRKRPLTKRASVVPQHR